MSFATPIEDHSRTFLQTVERQKRKSWRERGERRMFEDSFAA